MTITAARMERALDEAFAAVFSALARRCFTCDQPLRDDEGDPCDRCNDAAYYRAQAAEDR